MFFKFSMLMPVAFWLLHGGWSLLMSESWEMSPCKKLSYHFVAWFAHGVRYYFEMILKYVICKAHIPVIYILLLVYRSDKYTIYM